MVLEFIKNKKDKNTKEIGKIIYLNIKEKLHNKMEWK